MYIHLFFFKCLLFFLLSSVLGACGDATLPPQKISFYYWRTTWQLAPDEKASLRSLEVKTLFVRFFDVDWNPITKRPIPIGSLQITAPQDLGDVQIVPTVFITNRTMEHLSEGEVGNLAKNIYHKISHIYPRLTARQSPCHEIQIDCDWSDATRTLFFGLLDSLRRHTRTQGVQLSATIRLHQIKYASRTGVPPVDVGVLMHYNMGRLEEQQTENSILDPAIADKYLSNLPQYPLRLRLALPIFSWGVVLRRGRVAGLLPELSADLLSNDTIFEVMNESYFRVKREHYYQGKLLYPADLIRRERVSPDLLHRAYQQVASKRRIEEVIYYYLDSRALKHFTQEVLKNP